MKRILCCMFAAMMVFSALSPALADSSMLDAELSGRIGAKVSSYRDMADAPKSDVIVFSVNGEAVALICKRRLLLRGCPLLKRRKAFRIQRGKGRKVRVVRGSDAEGFHGGRKAEQKKCLNSA